jgi:hypothetical protein
MRNRAKNHHIVPKVLQKNFAIQGKHIWFTERQNNGLFHEPELRNIKKTFRKKDYYTVLEDGVRSDIIEKNFYGDIDNYLGRILPEVLDTFAKGNIPKFSGQPLYSIKQCVMQMAKRTPDFLQDHNDIDMGRKFAKGMLESADTNVRNKYQRYLDEPNNNKLRELGRDIRVRATPKNSERIEEALQNRSVHWAKIETNHSFILSSRMALWLGNGEANGLMNPLLEIWMPISPKISLILFWNKNKDFPLMNTVDRDFVRRLNMYAVENSNQIASHSKELLYSLACKK